MCIYSEEFNSRHMTQADAILNERLFMFISGWENVNWAGACQAM